MAAFTVQRARFVMYRFFTPGSFFLEPYFRHSPRVRIWFGLFYIMFLVLYFSIPATDGLRRRILFAIFFALRFLYFPFYSSASGAFVFPAVMLAFVMRDHRKYLLV